MTIEIGVLIAVGGLLLTYLGYQLNRTKEVKTDSQQDAQIKAQLDYIGKGVDDIRIDLRANERQMIAHGERITRLEESAKQAHKRLDAFAKKEEN
ncbi:hypothetical protein [Cytobacillus praedii]|uniref:Uncharacterized protein n=1 Tax=Cytobacillus praedii TaxID=1742358 RepID=A0A4R1ANV9_9BACI|nr:hypothetical protein [Cytobacillus praedii]TCJ01566.1 hypothetical protein E0Y62_23325 [Cytobacillus praedii]